jgi:hypothetical protein
MPPAAGARCVRGHAQRGVGGRRDAAALVLTMAFSDSETAVGALYHRRARPHAPYGRRPMGFVKKRLPLYILASRFVAWRFCPTTVAA